MLVSHKGQNAELKKKHAYYFFLLCQLHLLHAREITPTQVKPDSGSSPTLTFLYRIIWPESKSSSSPCGREAERYRTTGSGWKSEEEEETQDTTKKLWQSTVAHRTQPSLWYTCSWVTLSHHTHLTGTCCLLRLLGAHMRFCVWVCVC